MIIGIAGAAGSGKDTLATLMSKYIPAVSIAQASPMKAFAGQVFGFTDEQLYGPSESRNAVDVRFDNESQEWDEASARLRLLADGWIKEVLPGLDGPASYSALDALVGWFKGLRNFHWAEQRQLTTRYVLQTIGTEFGRALNMNMWNDYAIRKAFAALAETGGPTVALLTDVRFKNEVLGIKRNGGIVINVTSPAESDTAVEKAGVAGHKSESELKGIPSSWYDYVVVNDKTKGLLALENVAARLVRIMTAKTTTLSTDFMNEVVFG